MKKTELPPKRTPKNYNDILSQIKLFEMYPKVFAIVIKDDYLRSRVFLRYQEFYESDSETFRGHESCMSVIPDLNFYDLIMFCIVDTIRKRIGSDKFYLIGIDQSNGEDTNLIHHEMAHALWFADPSYKKKMTELINNMDKSTKTKMEQKIKGMGYGENVVNDEIQAYLSTGIIPQMSRIKNIKKEQIEFSNFFDSYIDKFKANKIPIDWSLHF